MPTTPTATSLGTGGQASTATTAICLVTSTVAIGTPIFAVFCAAGSPGDTHTFSDSKGSRWTTDRTFIDGVNGTSLSIGSAVAAGDLKSGVDTIQCVDNNSRVNVTVIPFSITGSGIMLPPTVDVLSPLPVNSGHSTSATPGSTTPRQPNLLGINVIVNFAGGGTAPAGWSEIIDTTDFGSFAFITINYTTTLTTSVTALNPAETITTSDWYSIMALYQSPPGRSQGQYGRAQGFSWR